MKKMNILTKSILRLENIEGFFIRKVTKFGTSAKVDCPKSYLGKIVYLVVVKHG